MESSDSGRVFDDDITNYIRRACGNYLVEYCGEFRTRGKLWDVYALESKLVKLFEADGLYPLMGYPQYIMLAKDGSDIAMMISDEDLKITLGVAKQVKQLRKEGHKRRPDQVWV